MPLPRTSRSSSIECKAKTSISTPISTSSNNRWTWYNNEWRKLSWNFIIIVVIEYHIDDGPSKAEKKVCRYGTCQPIDMSFFGWLIIIKDGILTMDNYNPATATNRRRHNNIAGTVPRFATIQYLSGLIIFSWKYDMTDMKKNVTSLNLV